MDRLSASTVLRALGSACAARAWPCALLGLCCGLLLLLRSGLAGAVSAASTSPDAAEPLWVELRAGQALDLVDHAQFVVAPAQTSPDVLAGPLFRPRFVPLSRFVRSADERSIWARVRLRGPADERWLLQVPYTVLRGWDVTLYQKSRGLWLASTVTRWTTIAARPTQDAGAVFPLESVGPQAQEIYVCFKQVVRNNTTLFRVGSSHVLPERIFYYYQSVDLIFYGIMFGMLMIMSVYNVMIYFSGQDRSYLWFSCTLIGYILYFLELQGIALHFFFREADSWRGWAPMMSIAGCVLMTVGYPHFLFSYIGIKAEFKIERIMIYISMMVVSVLIVLSYFWMIAYHYSDFRIFNYAVLPLVLASMVIIVRAALQRRREALFFLAASFALMAGITVQVLLSVGLLGISLWSRYTMPVGILLQVVVMAVALADRLRLTRLALIEREKSERLLLTMLPAPIAQRLKAGESPIADRHAEVTVLFADIAGFTPLSAELPPERIVLTLNQLFSRFDALTRERGLEKIKTIGDCYMVVGGLPLPRPDHAEAVADLALALLAEVQKLDAATDAGVTIRVRIGMHCGSAVAGVIGTTKPAYDLWGDTVNTASRMESHGEPGRIQCSEAMYARLADRFVFSERGEIEIRGKGRMRTFFVLGRRSEPVA